jgi:CDP-diacylglycerol---serine O-phosphatidyltransferase
MSPDIDPKLEKAEFAPVDGSQEDTSNLIEEHEEEISQNGRKFRRKGIYLLPNLLTTGALFAGFYAVIAGMGGDFHSACAAIVVAMFFDGMDGRVARLTNTQSAFGAEFDSLSDMVAFGVAPALICFSWALSGLGKIGWTVAFVYVACAALRLARFNVQRAETDKRFFVGLASPSAAGLVVFMVWAFSSYEVEVTRVMSIMAALVTGLAGMLMVMNVRYYSFKELDFKNPVPFFLTLVIVFVIVVVSWHPPTMLFLMAVSYALSGPLMAVYLRRKKKSAESPVSRVNTENH